MTKRAPSNRLWFQLSIAFASVVIVAAFALITLAYLFRPLRAGEPPLPPGITPAEVRARAQEVLTLTMIGYVTMGCILGIAAGVWMSRRLAAPLTELANAAERVGAGDLTQQVAARGSLEMVTVAESFNHMTAQLRAAERLRQNLLADVAHELRTPLTVLQGSLRAILDDVYELDKAEVARLYDQTRHLRRLVDDLHELAQAEARALPLDLQPADFKILVQDAAAVFEPVADEQGVTLAVAAPATPVPVQVDRARMMQVLQNLLVNALRHTPAGGAVTVSVETGAAEAVVSVQDTGDGIDAVHLAHVFDRFYRTDQARNRDAGGAGLGLAIVRALVEAHGGRVAVYSAGRGLGSTFTLTLPSVPPPPVRES